VRVPYAEIVASIASRSAGPGTRANIDEFTESIISRVAEVAQYVPGYTLRAEPQFDGPREDWEGWARVAVFLEVRGNGDYLPAWAGNLDIMTAAAARVGELLALAGKAEVSA
jgi:acetaldehyde dehydrogenase